MAVEELIATEPRGELVELNATGDTKIAWNQRNETEVEVARRAFDSLKEKGFTMFRETSSGAQGGQMRDFDPTAERIIAVPRMVGG